VLKGVIKNCNISKSLGRRKTRSGYTRSGNNHGHLAFSFYKKRLVSYHQCVIGALNKLWPSLTPAVAS
jgi:hypothetical protein